MAKDDEEEEFNNSSSEDEPKTLEINSRTRTDYEKQREARIAANNARLNSLGLRNLANSLIRTPVNRVTTRNSTPKSKRFVKKKDDDDDDEYEPDCDGNVDDDGDGDDDDDDDDFEEEETFVRRNRKGSATKVKKLKSKSGKKVSMSNLTDFPDFMDEDEALKQAITLSLKDPGDYQHGESSQKLNTQTASVREDNTQRRKRKLFTSRVQMTDDDLVIHFCQIDEAGNGGITLRDVARMAATHDFSWTDEELSDMIRCFDSDRDGKLTLDDFRNIAQRCNMLTAQESG